MSMGHTTDVSGTITTGGTAQVLLIAQPGRKYLFIQNPITATETLRFCPDVTATTLNSYELAPGGSAAFFDDGFLPTGAISILAATTAHAFIAKWA